MPRNRPDIDREEKIAQILNVAERCLRDQGEEALSVAGLARELGLAQNALYWYFPSRDDLIVAVLRRMMKDIARRKPSREQADLIERILWFIDQYEPVFELRSSLQPRVARSKVLQDFMDELNALVSQMLSGVLKAHVAAEELGVAMATFRAAAAGAYAQRMEKGERRKMLRHLLTKLLA